jgi:hypothetical protein
MPVVTTMAAIAILRSSQREPLPFFDAELLRALLDNALAEGPPGTLDQADRIVEKLEDLLEDYRTSVVSSLDAYIEESANVSTTAADLIERIEPLDEKRALTLREIIDLRQALLDLLDDRQWAATFE